MSPRVKISNTVETSVLVDSARRCALCFGLMSDLGLKTGQIAHINHNNADSQETNLAFLCLHHHDQYDTRTSQSKGISPNELKIYKKRLYEAIGRNEHIQWEASRDPKERKADEIRRHDEEVFQMSDSILTEESLNYFLDNLHSDNSYLSSSGTKIIDFCDFFAFVKNEFIETTVSDLQVRFVNELILLKTFIATHFFYYPDKQHSEDSQYCLYPNLNVDRQGDGTEESMNRYLKFQIQLSRQLEDVSSAYKEYRRAIKTYLLI